MMQKSEVRLLVNAGVSPFHIDVLEDDMAGWSRMKGILPSLNEAGY